MENRMEATQSSICHLLFSSIDVCVRERESERKDTIFEQGDQCYCVNAGRIGDHCDYTRRCTSTLPLLLLLFYHCDVISLQGT